MKMANAGNVRDAYPPLVITAGAFTPNYGGRGNTGLLSPEERFWHYTAIVPGSCWVWCGPLWSTRPKTYGLMTVGGRKNLVHRYAYELIVGPIPEGLTIDHLCMNRLCVNPLHLEPVTGAENTRRGADAKVICKHGHPLTGANVRTHGGRRYCRTCNRERVAAFRAHNLAVFNDGFRR